MLAFFDSVQHFERELEYITTHLALPGWVYMTLLLGLFVIPRILQRVALPRAITCFALGICAAGVVSSFGFDTHDVAIELLATLGIVSLFLFAGLEADTSVIVKHPKVFGTFFLVGAVGFAAVATFLGTVLDLKLTTSALVALAVLTPSAGYILESLESMKGTDKEKFWIRSTVISTEIIALGVMFVTLQSHDFLLFMQSSLILLAMVLALPQVFKAFATWIVPHAPKSEFAFLIVVAICCAFMTKALGVYYLVGAFVVGMAAQRFQKELPAMASHKMLESVEAFASLFVPFYFFKAGLSLRLSDLGLEAVLTGVALVAIAIPVRLGVVAAHRRLATGENWETGMRLSVAMLPTLVFTLVIAQILKGDAQFALPDYLFGALIVYALISTLIPTYLLRDDAAQDETVGEPVDEATPGATEPRASEPEAAAEEQAPAEEAPAAPEPRAPLPAGPARTPAQGAESGDASSGDELQTTSGPAAWT